MFDGDYTKMIGIAAVTIATLFVVSRFFGNKQSSTSSTAATSAGDGTTTKSSIKTTRDTETTMTSTASTVQLSTSVLHNEHYRKFRLQKIETLTKGANVQFPVKLFRFALPNPDDSLGLPIGQHIKIRATLPTGENNSMEVVERSYTPTSTNDDKGYFDLVIKIYPSGKMTQYFDKLVVGDEIEVKGPSGRFLYEKNKFTEIGMIAGGTGITPMLQVVKEILKHSDDSTKITLLYGNVTEDDIILREDIDRLAQQYENFRVYHVLNKFSEDWTMGKGFITAAHIDEHLPKPSSTTKILLCGPPLMIKSMKEHLTGLKFTRDHIFTF